MTTKRNPEERSERSAAEGAGGIAKPTGDEVFEPASASPRPSRAERETNGSGTPEEARAHLRQMAAGYYENLAETAEELSREASEVFGTASAYMRRNPWTSVLTAVGAGLLIGLILSDD